MWLSSSCSWRSHSFPLRGIEFYLDCILKRNSSRGSPLHWILCFSQMEYDYSKQLFFPSKLAEKMQVDISVLISLPQISLTGCHLATGKKYEVCKTWESNCLWQAKGLVQVGFFASNKIWPKHKEASVQRGKKIYLCSECSLNYWPKTFTTRILEQSWRFHDQCCYSCLSQMSVKSG